MKQASQLIAALTLLAISQTQAFAAASFHDIESGAVYTMSNATGGNAVLRFQRGPDGRLAAPVAYPTGGSGTGSGLGNQGAVNLSDDGRWLFVVNPGSDELSVFAVGRSGLSLTQTIKSGGALPVSVTSNDDLVYVLNAGSDSIAGFRLGNQGRLQAMPDSYRPLSASNAAAAQIQFSPDGRALVVTEKATNKIDVYQVDRDGLPEIAPQIVASAGQTPFGFSFGKHNRLFVTEAAGGAPGASSVSSYRLTRTGDLSLIDGPVATGLTAACWAVVTPDGRYTYIAETGSEAVSAFEINRRGDLSLRDANGITASTGAGSVPIDLAMSDNGRYLYSLSSKNHTLNEYRVEADGGLVAIGALTNLPPSMNGLAAR